MNRDPKPANRPLSASASLLAGVVNRAKGGEAAVARRAGIRVAVLRTILSGRFAPKPEVRERMRKFWKIPVDGWTVRVELRDASSPAPAERPGTAPGPTPSPYDRTSAPVRPDHPALSDDEVFQKFIDRTVAYRAAGVLAEAPPADPDVVTSAPPLASPSSRSDEVPDLARFHAPPSPSADTTTRAIVFYVTSDHARAELDFLLSAGYRAHFVETSGDSSPEILTAEAIAALRTVLSRPLGKGGRNVGARLGAASVLLTHARAMMPKPEKKAEGAEGGTFDVEKLLKGG